MRWIASHRSRCAATPHHRGFPFRYLGLQQVAQLAMDKVERLEVARGAGDDDRALDRGGGQHREFFGTCRGHAVCHQPLGDEIGPAGEGRRGAVDHRRRLILLGGVAGFHRHRDDGTTRAVIGAKQLLAVIRDKAVEGVETAFGLGDLGRNILAGVIDCLTQQLSTATGKVVIRRAAGGAAVLEHIGDRRRLRAAFPDQKRGRDHHPLAGAGHESGSLRPTRLCMSPYITAARAARPGPRSCLSAGRGECATHPRRLTAGQNVTAPQRLKCDMA